MSKLQALRLQHTQWPKNNIIDCYEILVQKTDYRWHGSDKACKLDICGQTLIAFEYVAIGWVAISLAMNSLYGLLIN